MDDDPFRILGLDRSTCQESDIKAAYAVTLR
jgi:hypothetical protein